MNENALKVIDEAKDRGDLVYVDQNVIPQTDMFCLEATEITLGTDDTHDISGKLMPKREIVDRISAAAGIRFLAVSCFTETREDAVTGKHTVYIGRARGEIRMPDGSWRSSTIQYYEFDPTLRAMLDKGVVELTSETRKVVGRLIMEYQKCGMQRAQTGARVRVTRELTGMPTALTKEQAKKTLVFARVVQNTSYILNTPEGRNLATAQALGMDLSALYGQQRQLAAQAAEDTPMVNVTPTAEPDPEPEVNETPPGAGADLAAQAAAGDDGNIAKLSVDLENILATHKDILNVETQSGNPYVIGNKELDNFGATAKSLTEMIDRMRRFLKRQGVEI